MAEGPSPGSHPHARIPALRVATLLIGAVAASSCASLYLVRLEDCPVRRVSIASKVAVRYLGAGGFLLSRGEDVLMTAPLYSAPSLLEVALDHHVGSDTDLIDERLPQDARSARAILVGHSHYYRLMDVPYLALAKARGADIYGSQTTAHLLAPIAPALRSSTPPRRIVALDDTAAFDQQTGHWHPLGNTMRFMAIRSHHAPLATLKIRLPFRPDVSVPLRLWHGKAMADRTTLPASVSEWVEGTVFSFLIDFLEPGGRVGFRVLYVDSGAAKPHGYPPVAILRERGLDLAILSAWGDLENVAGYPEDLLRLTKPHHVIVAQWENFFVDQRVAESLGGPAALPPTQAVAAARVGDFVERVKKVLPRGAPPPWVPCPSRSVLEFPITPRPGASR